MPSTILTFTPNSTLSPTDAARVRRLEGTVPVTRRGGLVPSPSAYSSPSSSAVTSGGQISPTSGISATGNTFTFTVQGQMAGVWDGTLLHLYWDGTNGSTPFVILRADMSRQPIPTGSITISGLAAGTPYGFAPFISVAQPTRVSFVSGNSGSPLYAFNPSATPSAIAAASQTQRSTANERLSDGLIYFTTGTATANSSPTGSPAPLSPYTGT